MREIEQPEPVKEGRILPFRRTVPFVLFEDTAGVYRLEVDSENPYGESRGIRRDPDELLTRDEPIPIDIYRRSRLQSPEPPDVA